MTTIGVRQEFSRAAQPAQSAGIVRRVLLACGILSSILYVASDVIGGMLYEGYSFTSQAISELSAIGSPAKAFVDVLSFGYGVLVLAFGVGVFRAAGSGERALRITGAAIIGYGTIGLVGSFVGPYFAMHPRGTGPVSADAPHIVLTGILVLLLLVSIGSGAIALGERFRKYSLASLAAVILFGALTFPYPARMAARQPTPGLGIIERIDVYSALLWLAVLGVALLQRRDPEVEESRS